MKPKASTMPIHLLRIFFAGKPWKFVKWSGKEKIFSFRLKWWPEPFLENFAYLYGGEIFIDNRVYAYYPKPEVIFYIFLWR